MSIYTANVYGQIGGEPKELPYIKKTGDTATGLIKFEGGLETDIGTATFNGPVVLNDDVTFTPNSTLFVDGEVEFANDVTFTGGVVTCNVPFTSNASVIMNNPSTVNALMVNNAGLTMKGGSDIDIYDQGYIQWSAQGGGIIYTDQSLQESAYTGAKTLAGNYTNTNITIGNQGQISAISSGPSPFIMPAGSITMWGGTDTPPAGWLICNGQEIPETGIYAALFAAIGYRYSTNYAPPFKVPNMVNNFPVGATINSPGPQISLLDGFTSTSTQNFTNGGYGQISKNMLPDHTHQLDFPSTTYVKDVNAATDCSTGGTKSRVYSVSEGTFPGGTLTNYRDVFFFYQQEYRPPFVVVNFIIKL